MIFCRHGANQSYGTLTIGLYVNPPGGCGRITHLASRPTCIRFVTATNERRAGGEFSMSCS